MKAGNMRILKAAQTNATCIVSGGKVGQSRSMVASTEEGRVEESLLISSMLKSLLSRLGRPLQSGRPFLDIGCGHGNLVKILRAQGIEAFGADFYPNPLSIPSPSGEDRAYLRPILPNPYQLPFDSNCFNVVYSNQVLEHVHDLETTLIETSRVMQKGGFGLHIYPATWRVLESHIRVPFAGGIQSKAWIMSWTMLGLGTRPQGLSVMQAAADNYRYMREQTAYRSVHQVEVLARRLFSKVHWNEADYLLSATGRARVLKQAGPILPLVACLFRHFVSRVLILEK